jgi:uncharacterized protein (TIGR00369 family)
MADADTDARRWKETAQKYMGGPLHGLLAAEIQKIGLDGGEIAFETQEAHITPGKTLHGGIIYVGIELANLIASIPHTAQGEWMITIDTSYTLIGTTRGNGQTVTLQSRLIKRTKRYAFFEGMALDDKGNVLAKSRTTKSIGAAPTSKL